MISLPLYSLLIILSHPFFSIAVKKTKRKGKHKQQQKNESNLEQFVSNVKCPLFIC